MGGQFRGETIGARLSSGYLIWDANSYWTEPMRGLSTVKNR